MAAASEIRNQTLKQIRATFLKMSSPEWDLALMTKSDEAKQEAALEYARVQRARLRLGNAELANIRDKLIENEADLTRGRARLAKALENLNRVKQVLGAVSSLLDTVAKVVPLT